MNRERAVSERVKVSLTVLAIGVGAIACGGEERDTSGRPGSETTTTNRDDVVIAPDIDPVVALDSIRDGDQVGIVPGWVAVENVQGDVDYVVRPMASNGYDYPDCPGEDGDRFPDGTFIIYEDAEGRATHADTSAITDAGFPGVNGLSYNAGGSIAYDCVTPEANTTERGGSGIVVPIGTDDPFADQLIVGAEVQDQVAAEVLLAERYN